MTINLPKISTARGGISYNYTASSTSGILYVPDEMEVEEPITPFYGVFIYDGA